MEVLAIEPSGDVATTRFLGMDGTVGPIEEVEGVSLHVRPVGLERDPYWRDAGQIDVHVHANDPQVNVGDVIVFEGLSVSLSPDRDDLFAVVLVATGATKVSRDAAMQRNSRDRGQR